MFQEGGLGWTFSFAASIVNAKKQKWVKELEVVC